MKTLRVCLLTGIMLCAFFFLTTTVCATEEVAQDITAQTTFSGSGYNSFRFLKDGNTEVYQTSNGNVTITLSNPDEIGGLYLMFDQPYGEYLVTNNATGDQYTAGYEGYLHEYIDIYGYFGGSTSLTLHFNNGAVRLSEITVLSCAEEIPASVQRWEYSLDGGADLVLFSSHGDDEHLYFAGLLPYYAGEKGYAVQVVYLTDHRNDTNKRVHEMLNGLWAAGVRAYPVFGEFADFRVDSLNGTYNEYANTYGTSQEELLSFVVAQIRRFRPIVAVGHDLKGEYGHGMHQVYADLLTKAVKISNNPDAFPESVQLYGTHEISKLYLHLYGDNRVTMDYDTPLEAFNGMTAFEVSQKVCFPLYKTQQWPMFTEWLYGKNNEITKASQIQTYSPTQFGLYHSTVGEDVNKNDLFENVLTYYQQEQQEADRIEQEQQQQQQQEQDRIEQEQQEQERLEQEEYEQQVNAQIQEEQSKTTRTIMLLVCALVAAIVALIAVPIVIKRYRYMRYRKQIEEQEDQ